MKSVTTKLIAGSAAAMLLVPTLAFAHEDSVKAHVGVSIGNRIEKALDRIEHKGKNEVKKDEHKVMQATTTAAAITKKATAVQVAADTMLSFNSRVSALIASSSAETKAALQTQFNTFTTAATNAKVEAGKAISGSAQVNATNSTTTNATLLAAAKVDLKEAKSFLNEARKALFSIFQALF